MAAKQAKGAYAPDGSIYITLTDGAGNLATTGGGTTTIGTSTITGGTNTRVLFDDSGVIGEDAGLTYNKTTDSLTIGGDVTVGNGVQVTSYYLFGNGTNFQSPGSGAVTLYNNGNTLSATLAVDAANTLAQRNGTNGQSFRVYDTYTDGSNYRRAVLAGGLFLEAVGSGAVGAGMYVYNRDVGPIYFGTNNSSRWTIDANGHFITGTDNLYDIGASGATRPRNLYVAGSGTFGVLSLPATSGQIVWSTQGFINYAADGVLVLHDNAGSSFGRLTFGGTTSSFPALKRVFGGFQVRLADDSGFTSIQGQLVTHSNAAAETITPDHTIIIYDASGTAYRVPCQV